MKKILSLKYLTSACFLAVLLTMLACSWRPCYYIAYEQLQNLRSGEGISISQIEEAYNDAIPWKTSYITFNGGFQRLMGLRHVNERYLLDNGHLTYVISETDVEPYARNIAAFRDALEEMGIPFGHVNTLFKIDPEDKQLPVGVEDYSNENTDRFLKLLKETGVTTLDLRQKEKEQGLDHYSLYYVTDHHWKAETGFWAYIQVVQWLEQLDSSFSVDPVLTDPESYDYTVYEDIFCGSAARRVGPLYAGVDDLTLITPKYDTGMELAVPAKDIYRQGSYEETMLFYENLTWEDMMERSAYSVYTGSDHPLMTIKNHSGQQLLDVRSTPKKLLILKDSTALVLVPYLALSYDEICVIDLRYFQEDLLGYIREYRPDMVLTMYNPGALDGGNDVMFSFGIE